MIERIVLFSICIFFLFTGNAQVKQVGTPYISNYPRETYQAATQNWSIAQDKEGFLYFANNSGVLLFDGASWQLIPISRSSPTRSIMVSSSNRIFVGASNEFGEIVVNENGEREFKSFLHLLQDKDFYFEDIWRIYEMPYGIIFQSFNGIFIYNKDKIDVLLPKKEFHFSFKVENRLFVHEPDDGLYELINGGIHKVPWDDTFADKEVWCMLPYQEKSILIGTARRGIYKYYRGKLEKLVSPLDDFLIKNKLFTATKIQPNAFAFGTILNGIVVADQDGMILQHVNKEKGLQNNTVLSSFVDRDKNLWLGLDNGIGYVEINSPLSLISNFEDVGTGYCAIIFDDNVYLGTNKGLYVKSFSAKADEEYRLIENTTGQVWSLKIIDEKLFCGHNLGAFIVEGNKAKQISNEPGFWLFEKISGQENSVIAGSYNGLNILKKDNSGWSSRRIKGFDESSRFLQKGVSNEVWWVSHGAKGVFKLELNDKRDSVIQLELYGKSDGLPSDERNILLRFQNKNIISTEKGIYRYSISEHKFVLDTSINELFDTDSWIKTIRLDREGNIWFIGDGETGVLRLNEDFTYTKITAPFRRLNGRFVNSFEFIYPHDNDNVFIGIDDGFAHYSSKMPKSYSTSFNSYITKIDIPYLDSTININDPTIREQEYSFPYKKNTFRFQYTSPFYEDLEGVMYSYKMVGFNDEWSEFTADNYKDFTNLYEGDYIFHVRAKNVYDTVSAESSFSFSIHPPWFRSLGAYVVYAAFLMLVIFSIMQYLVRRVELSKKREKERHLLEIKKKEEAYQRKVLKADKEISDLKNEKLHAEMIHRDKELANQTMNIIHKNRSLQKIKRELRKIQTETTDSALKTRIALVNSRIDKEIDDKKQKKVFDTYFDESHEEFFKALKEKFPDLTPNELRLCAYIKMNISTKEIAALSNISTRGVEVSRYRLRKKMDLQREDNLSVFLTGI